MMNVVNPEVKWPHRWFGFFRSNESEDTYVPLLSSYIDPEWNIPDRSRVLDYLNNSPCAVASSPMKTCMICNESLPAAVFMSDGEWLWPKSLVHLMESHYVRLPNEFVESIRRRDYAPPLKCPVPVKDLPWPLPPGGGR